MITSYSCKILIASAQMTHSTNYEYLGLKAVGEKTRKNLFYFHGDEFLLRSFDEITRGIKVRFDLKEMSRKFSLDSSIGLLFGSIVAYQMIMGDLGSVIVSEIFHWTVQKICFLARSSLFRDFISV